MSSETKGESNLDHEEQELIASLQETRGHIVDYRAALDSGRFDHAMDQWTEAVQVLQKLYHNEQVFLLKYRLLLKRKLQ